MQLPEKHHYRLAPQIFQASDERVITYENNWPVNLGSPLLHFHLLNLLHLILPPELWLLCFFLLLFLLDFLNIPRNNSSLDIGKYLLDAVGVTIECPVNLINYHTDRLLLPSDGLISHQTINPCD